MTKKKYFDDPKLEIVSFEEDDIITSSTDPDDPIPLDPWDDWND